MIRYGDIHMPNPCNKIHYDSLPFDSVKRPCHVCNKPVYDFRDKDEKFLNKIWKKHNGDFCGAFGYEQFNETSNLREINSGFKYLRNSLITFLLGIWTFLSKAQEVELSEKPMIENASDTLLTWKSKSFLVMTEDCKSCLDEFYIKVLINNIYYDTYKVKDSSVISLPDSVKPTDVITIERRRRIRRKGWVNVVTKTKKVEFTFGEKDVVEVRTTKKMKIRIIYRRSWIGCPKFRT